MLSEALYYPRRADNWHRTLLIGGVLLLLSPLLFPALAVQGYFVRVLRDVIDDIEEPPAFDGWVELLVDGLQVLVVQLVYGLIPAALVLGGSIVVGLGAFVVSEGGGSSASVGTGLGLLAASIVLLGFLFGLLAAYLTPVAIANFAHEDDLVAAFDLGTIREVATSRAYVVAVLRALVIGIGVAVVGVLLSITVVGILLVVFVAFYAQVAVYYLVGRGFAGAMGLDRDRDGAESDPGVEPTG